MKVVYQGQIGAVAGLSEEDHEVMVGESAREFIKRIARDKPEQVAQLLLDGSGGVLPALFVAADGARLSDLDSDLTTVKELLLMPPIAGG